MPEWMTTADVAAKVHRHPVTVLTAAESGLLHGHQPRRRGRWSFAPAAVDAWVMALGEKAQLEACGCVKLRHQPRRSRS